MSNIINFSDYCRQLNSDNPEIENLHRFATIAPLIRDVCLSAGVIGNKADEVIEEYQRYFEQLTALENTADSGAQFNHACHIILGLLIKDKLRR